MLPFTYLHLLRALRLLCKSHKRTDFVEIKNKKKVTSINVTAANVPFLNPVIITAGTHSASSKRPE
jgi:hypothetical protein